MPPIATRRGLPTRRCTLLIAEATHNPILVGMSVDLRAKITLNLGAEPYTAEARRTAIVQHAELVAAVSEGRGDDAAEIAARHFAISETLIREARRSCRARRRPSRSAMMSGQLVFIVRRLLLTIPMLFVMSVVVFLIIRLVPGDPVRTMLGFRATDENVAELTRQLGLDQPCLSSTWAGPARCCAAILARTS